MSTWWLSFCDPNLPEGSQFLGVSIVRVHGGDIVLAASAAHILGCNPGGEVQGFDLEHMGPMVPDSYRDRLLTRAECDEVDAIVAKELGHE